MITKSTDEWMEILDKAGVPCAPVLHRKEMIHHPQVVANGIVQEYEHEEAGPLRQARKGRGLLHGLRLELVQGQLPLRCERADVLGELGELSGLLS